MSIIDWPTNLRYNHANIPLLERNVASAGVSVSGQERFIATDAGRWRYSVKVRLATKTQALAFRAMVSQAEGRGNRIRVPILDIDADPAAIAGVRSVSSFATIPHSDGAYFSDGSGYAVSYSNGTVSTGGVQGGTSISVTMPTGLVPEPGHFFSDGDNLYQVKTSTLATGTTYDLTFRPRLRADIGLGTEISFDRLYCLMRIADDDATRPEQDQAFTADADITFVEALV